LYSKNTKNESKKVQIKTPLEALNLRLTSKQLLNFLIILHEQNAYCKDSTKRGQGVQARFKSHNRHIDKKGNKSDQAAHLFCNKPDHTTYVFNIRRFSVEDDIENLFFSLHILNYFKAIQILDVNCLLVFIVLA